VSVTVAHRYRGSLVVSLISPRGTRYLLKTANRADIRANLAQTYRINLAGVPRNGKWTLQVRDVYGATTGVLDSWRLTL
jgi:subtilisin-like proprotein convertase family protein